VQIERARRTVPHATFVCADMSEVDFPARSFAAIVSFYAIIHLPLSEQPGLLARIHQWLEPHGRDADRGKRVMDGRRGGLVGRGWGDDVLESRGFADLPILANSAGFQHPVDKIHPRRTGDLKNYSRPKNCSCD